MTSYGKDYIDRIQAIESPGDYCTELNEQYAFLKQMDGKVVESSGGQKARYILTKSYDDIQTLMDAPDDTDTLTLAVMLSIEGA